jgi:light-regulated signal transduction histidine kinase (bacteriophytochrome)
VSATFSDQDLQQVVEQLKKANAELERFAYVASHDLKAPLRAISNLANWIKEDINSKNITAETISHLNMMMNRVSRMEKLLDDVLAYAKVGKRDNTFEEVDILGMIKSIVDMLPADHFEVVAQTNASTLFAERYPLEQVLRNLIGNAIKHHHTGRGKIQINITEHEKHFEFLVEDDGPGIPQENREEVFEMFKTLKPRDEVEGSGMGLALVKKIVETQGYTVQVLPPTNSGLRIQFSWPKFRKYRENE